MSERTETIRRRRAQREEGQAAGGSRLVEMRHSEEYSRAAQWIRLWVSYVGVCVLVCESVFLCKHVCACARAYVFFQGEEGQGLYAFPRSAIDSIVGMCWVCLFVCLYACACDYYYFIVGCCVYEGFFSNVFFSSNLLFFSMFSVFMCKFACTCDY